MCKLFQQFFISPVFFVEGHNLSRITAHAKESIRDLTGMLQLSVKYVSANEQDYFTRHLLWYMPRLVSNIGRSSDQY